MSHKTVEGDRSAARGDDPLPPVERRRSPRVGVLLRVEYDSEENLAADYVTDLADGGLFIRTDLTLEVGTELALSLSFPGLLEPTDVDCVVRWRRQAGADVPREEVGVGVEFLGESPERTRVNALLARLTAKTRSKPKTCGTFRVLLVEDNAFVSELFGHAVRRLHDEMTDYESQQLLVARTGVEALRVLTEQKPDMVLLDHYLPGLTGCALVRRIRAMPEHENTPVLMISMGGDEVRREALDAGVTLYLDKPILLTQLLDTLRALLVREQPCG